MPQTSDRLLPLRQNPAIERRFSGFPRVASGYATNRLEQILILATVALLPLQEYVPAIGGFSVMYLLFGAQAGYLLAKRPDCVAKTWLHPLLLAVYFFLFIGFFMEFTHVEADYDEIFRMLQTFAGSIFLASLCRDRKAMRMAMYGYIGAGLLFAVNLLLNSYGALSGSTAVDYGEAERVRAAVFEQNPLQYNLNGMAFFTAQGSSVALALALTSQSRRSQYFFYGAAFVCFLATFLPMSRSGIAILVGVCASVVLKYGLSRIKTLIIGILAVAVLVVLVPPAVWQRLEFSTETQSSGKMEGRAAVYTAFFHHLPEFALTGVGVGNYFGKWGRQSQYGDSKGRVSGAHNVFFQMMIYWGIPALLGLFAIIWQGYRCLPSGVGDDGLAMGLICVSLSLVFWALTVHNLYAKEFSLGIGLLVAAEHWVWPASGRQVSRRARRVLQRDRGSGL